MAVTTTVRDIMSPSVVSLFAEQTLPLAEDIMRYKHVRHLPVIDDDGRLVGLVSHRDLLRAHVSSLAHLSTELMRERVRDVKVREIMTQDVWTVAPETLASVAGRTLMDHPFGCLPVVDEGRRLIGIVTERDFLRFAMRLLG